MKKAILVLAVGLLLCYPSPGLAQDVPDHGKVVTGFGVGLGIAGPDFDLERDANLYGFAAGRFATFFETLNLYVGGQWLQIEDAASGVGGVFMFQQRIPDSRFSMLGGGGFIAGLGIEETTVFEKGVKRVSVKEDKAYNGRFGFMWHVTNMMDLSMILTATDRGDAGTNFQFDFLYDLNVGGILGFKK